MEDCRNIMLKWNIGNTSGHGCYIKTLQLTTLIVQYQGFYSWNLESLQRHSIVGCLCDLCMYAMLVNIVCVLHYLNVLTCWWYIPLWNFFCWYWQLGDRTANILKHLFPMPKPDTKRIITFANQSDYISFRLVPCSSPWKILVSSQTKTIWNNFYDVLFYAII